MLPRRPLPRPLDRQQRVRGQHGDATRPQQQAVRRGLRRGRAVRLVRRRRAARRDRTSRPARQLHLGDLRLERDADADHLRRQRQRPDHRAERRPHDLLVLRHDVSGPDRGDAAQQRSGGAARRLLGDQHVRLRAHDLHLRGGHAAPAARHRARATSRIHVRAAGPPRRRRIAHHHVDLTHRDGGLCWCGSRMVECRESPPS